MLARINDPNKKYHGFETSWLVGKRKCYATYTELRASDTFWAEMTRLYVFYRPK